MSGASAEVAIVGVGQTDFGALYASKDAQRDENALGAEALRLALEDAGLKKSDLDGLLTARVRYDRMANVVGMRNPRVVNGLDGSGRMSGVAVQHAAALIRAGQAEVVACVYGNNGRSVQMRPGGDTGDQMAAYDLMYGMTSPGASAAMMYQRYKQMYGAPEDALAPLAINNRRNAVRNPVAAMRSEIDTEQYLAARYIAEPLRLFDYCVVNDGGVALILTSVERARSLRKRPVWIAASAVMGELTNYYSSADFFYAACQEVGSRVYRESGLGPEDIDCLQIYDNFTPAILFSLEGFGHAERGSAWEWIRDGRIRLEGKRPVNTSGGHTGESYMQGWALHVEAVRQIRGECGVRQVSGCDTAQYMCASPVVSSHVLVGE